MLNSFEHDTCRMRADSCSRIIFASFILVVLSRCQFVDVTHTIQILMPLILECFFFHDDGKTRSVQHSSTYRAREITLMNEYTQ